jgi:hypothetical protein
LRRFSQIWRRKTTEWRMISTDYTDYTDFKNKKLNGKIGPPQRNIFLVLVVLFSLNLCNRCNLWIKNLFCCISICVNLRNLRINIFAVLFGRF